VDYLPRVIDGELDQLIEHIAAIAIEGAKGVGKTATAQRRATSTWLLTRDETRETLAADLSLLAREPTPVLLDEWQLLPGLWNEVKMAVDQDPSGGRFILTGSAGPKPETRLHSGAGRILRLVMRPLALSERFPGQATVSLAQMLSGAQPALGGSSTFGLDAYTDEIMRSGFPAIRSLPERPRRRQLDSYLALAVEHDIEENGGRVRRPEALTAWLRAYAAATSTTAAYSNILDAATPGESNKPARQTVAAYRETLIRLFVLDPLPAWQPSLAPLTRLVGVPKHHLVDPALAARLIGASREALIKGEGDRIAAASGSLLGALFESLATLTVRVLAAGAEANVFHLRTKEGAREIDLIAEGQDRRVVAFEVKLARAVSDHDVRHLLWLREKIGPRLADAAVLTTGERAYRRPDGIGVIPLALLGP
jgi:predicted AAA+ superfamily ATPase